MAHLDYSTICPIFDEGVENDLVIPYQLSCTVTAYPAFSWVPGREVVVFEAKAGLYMSTGLSTACSCTLYIAKDQSMSTKIGSLACPTSALATFGFVQVAGSVTSTALTSTDILTLWVVTGGGACKAGGNYILIRYRDK